jgi:outer membrane protein OmpA-like peptidoglycan-associated protein
MKKRCWFCSWWVMLPLILGLSVLGTLGGCTAVQRDLDGKAERALDAAGLDKVSSKFSYRSGTLSGPAADETAALAAVAAVKGVPVKRLKYVPDGSAAVAEPAAAPADSAAPSQAPPVASAAPESVAAPTTVTEPAAAPAAAPVLDLSAVAEGAGVVLTGNVPGQGAHDRLVDAATGAFGAANVVDKLTIDPAAGTSEQDAAIDQLGSLMPTLETNLEPWSATLQEQALAITGTATGAEALGTVNSALDTAGAAGAIELTQTIDVGDAADPTAVAEELRSILSISGINFEPSSAVITQDSLPTLDRAVTALTAAFGAVPNLNVAIEGHTDSDGSAGSNQSLSERRANAVLTYLSDRGVPADRLTAAGFGADRPIADNATPEGRSQNRRIEFTIQES